MKNILYLSYDGLTDPLGQSQILPLLKSLSSYGLHFHVVSFDKVDRLNNQKDIVNTAIEGHNIEWYPMKYHKSPPVIGTIWDILKMRRLASKLAASLTIDAVHCRSYIPMLIGLLLKQRFGSRVLFDMRGFWADERIDGGLWSLKNPLFKLIYNYFKRKEIEFVSRADHIVSLTQAGKDEMTSGALFIDDQIRINQDKISVIPCAVDLDFFDPKKINKKYVQELRSKLSLGEAEKILLYLGSLGTWYMLGEMLSFFQSWKKDNPDSKFLFLTKDPISQIHESCNEHGIDIEEIIVVSADRDEVPLYLQLADLGIFLIKPAYSKKASSAVKMGEMMSGGLPFIMNINFGDGKMLVEDGVLKESERKYINELVIGKTVDNRELLLNYARENYALELCVNKYMGVYSLIQNR